MLYCSAKYELYAQDISYKAYVAESLNLSVQRKYLNYHWIDTLQKPKEEKRTGDEIAFDVINRAGLRLGGEK